MAFAILFLQRIIIKKGGGFLLLPFLFCIASCSNNLAESGKVSLHESLGENKYFVFTVSDKFLEKNKESPADEANPKMSEAESQLLIKLLKEKRYCANGSELSFVINSRQEKVYDMTFAHLIEKNYNARPISPRSYFGRCRN
jgi:hypothetical protein